MTRIVFNSDKGPRDNLEDAGRAITVSPHVPHASQFTIMAIGDGVGGAACGELASAIATQQIPACITAGLAGMVAETESPSSDMILGLMVQALELANQAILGAASASADRRGMATTVVCAVIAQGVLHVVWLGDSRCYVYRQGSLHLLTHDHSEAQELVDAGVRSSEDARGLPCTHAITRYLGQKDFQPVETRIWPLAPGDCPLLCTDGLTDVLEDDEIGAVVGACLDPSRSLDLIPRQLIACALQAGTTDNVTVMACHYQPVSRQPSAAADRTQTGAYPVRRAQALRQLHKETHHADSVQYTLFK